MLLNSFRRADERAKTVREFTAEGIAGYSSRGEKLAERKAAARHPTLAQTMQAEQEKQQKQRAAALRREFEKQLERERSRERGGRGR
jgi:hypothetical protein